MPQQDKPTDLSCCLRPDTGYKRALLLKRHSPKYNLNQEVFSGRRKLKIKRENIAKPPFGTGLMPFHLFSHLAGHSSLPGAMLEEELGESKQPLISMVEIPADVSPPACYTLPYRSCCTNLQACLFPGGTTDTAGAGHSSCPLQQVATKRRSPSGAEAGCCRGPSHAADTRAS